MSPPSPCGLLGVDIAPELLGLWFTVTKWRGGSALEILQPPDWIQPGLPKAFQHGSAASRGLLPLALPALTRGISPQAPVSPVTFPRKEEPC